MEWAVKGKKKILFQIWTRGSRRVKNNYPAQPKNLHEGNTSPSLLTSSTHFLLPTLLAEIGGRWDCEFASSLILYLFI